MRRQPAARRRTTNATAPAGVRDNSKVAAARPPGRSRRRRTAGSTSTPRRLISTFPTSFSLTQRRSRFSSYGRTCSTSNAVAKGEGCNDGGNQVRDLRIEQGRVKSPAESLNASGPDHRSVGLVEVGARGKVDGLRSPQFRRPVPPAR